MPNRIIIAVLGLMLFAGSLAGCLPHQSAGGTIGGAYGGIAGAILDSRNPWRGGVIGATLGALAGATIADVSVHGAREAIGAGRPVEYRTEDRRARYYAEPLGYDEVRKCRRVRENIFVEGRLVRKRTVLYCDGDNYTPPPRYRYDRRYERYERDDDD